MAFGDLITQEKQWEIWRSDSTRLLLGRSTDYAVGPAEGLDLPPMRAPDLEYPSDHGGTGGKDLLSPRVIRLGVRLVAAIADLPTRLDNVAKVMEVSEADINLSFRLPQRSTRTLYVRPRRMAYAHDKRASSGVVDVALGFVALDPRIYALTEDSVVITIGAGSSSQGGTLTNDGTFETRPTFSIVGPATNPRIANAADGNRSIKVDVVLTGSDTLDIDAKARTVKLNGTDRYDLVRSDNQWWRVMPGANTVTYSRTGTTGSSPCTAKHRDAWSVH